MIELQYVDPANPQKTWCFPLNVHWQIAKDESDAFFMTRSK